jgi:para-aminobenzoate synthetase component 1
MNLVARLPPGSLPSLQRAWPEDRPLVGLLGTGRHWIMATRLAEIPFAAAAAQPLAAPEGATHAAASDAPRLPFTTGLVCLVSYDEHDAATAEAARAPSRAFRVEASLVLDRDTGELWECGAVGPDERALGRAVAASATDAAVAACAPPLGLSALDGGDAAYLARAAAAIEEIRAGRYYQINLLRYFEARLADGSQPGRAWALRRLASHGGPFAAALELPGLALWSFSPERFVRVRADAGRLRAETRPIKGTMARASGAADAASAAALLASRKDRAELHMIVDLMRNDLARVSTPGSVAVPEPTRLDSYVNVHHLSARVTSELRPDLTLGELLAAVCPGGSITGAPKIEVMRAIRAHEGRARRYFMGNLLYRDDRTGALDSSILIRTLVSEAGPAQLAAGGGLVIGSDPEAERREVEAKCRVVTA